MTATETITGRCLCGAVTVRAEVEERSLQACHCDMCQRHTSGMFISVATVPGSVEFTGPAKAFQSSEWADRGFCEVCGSTLWYGIPEEGLRHPSAGLFADAAGGEMNLEFFTDECPHGYALAGDHQKLTAKETLKMFGAD